MRMRVVAISAGFAVNLLDFLGGGSIKMATTNNRRALPVARDAPRVGSGSPETEPQHRARDQPLGARLLASACALGSTFRELVACKKAARRRRTKLRIAHHYCELQHLVHAVHSIKLVSN